MLKEDIVNIAEKCIEQDLCKDCPVRRGCRIRKGFYDLKYEAKMQQLNIEMIANFICMGIKLDVAIAECTKNANLLDKKRKDELQRHPTYSEQ